MPLLALLPLDLHTAISLIGLAGLTLALLAVTTGWRHIDRPAVLGQALGGLWTKDVFTLFGLSLTFIIVATILGTFIHRRIPSHKFERYVFILIVLIGAVLLINPT
ncbi:hypothetical protein [Oceanobacillus kapialis]|uniref:hypothetical protein n=1 Tax=Oceanobacillus kapialis TaxID=481353 RepID=UPI00384CC555